MPPSIGIACHWNMKMEPAAVRVARDFWARMASNDFASVAAVLAPGFAVEWPQTRERIRGAERFVRMNVEYPAQGPWRFTIHRLFGDEREAVSDVSITDGAFQARAVSFFEVADGLVQRLVEWWPEPYDAPADRAHLVEMMD